MPTDVVMPQMGESIFEGTITKWLKKPGESVRRDEPLFEISTDKVDAEIPSPANGVLKEIKAKEGETVQVNTVVAVIGEGNGAGAQASAPAQAATPAASAAKPTGGAASTDGPTQAQPPAPVAQGDGDSGGGAQASGPATDVVMPQMGESIFEGTITKWLKKVGDQIRRDEPLFEISTDKVDAEIPAPTSGVLREIRAQEGDTVQVNSVVAVIGGAGGAAPAAAPAQGQAARAAQTRPAQVAAPQAPAVAARAESEPAEAEGADGERVRSSPLVRKIAKEHNIDVAQVHGSGLGGRVTKDDILKFIETGGAPQKATGAQGAKPAQAPQPGGSTPPPQPARTGGAINVPGDVVPMTAMRKKIAERMVESKRTSAHVHSVFKVDMSRVIAVRQKAKKDFENRTGTRLTMMPFFCRAAIEAMRPYPIVNASVEGDNIRYHRNVNLGIAVALDWGLIVPVIKRAEELNFLGIQRAILDLADRARAKKLVPDEVAGGTFTITNPGQFGQEFGLPIIMQPQVAILGVGSVKKEAVVITDENGQDSIAIRSIGHISLGYDHRIIDGAVADQFLRDVAKYLENWNEPLG